MRKREKERNKEDFKQLLRYSERKKKHRLLDVFVYIGSNNQSMLLSMQDTTLKANK